MDPDFGRTVREVRTSGFEIDAEVDCVATGDSRQEMAATVGREITAFSPLLEKIAPDWLIVLGDRGEQLAAAFAASHLGIPIAHLHGGEVTRGAIDDTVRDLITRLAHVHLPAHEAAAARIRMLGEESWRIRVVGAAGLDQLRAEASGDLKALRSRFGLGDVGPYLVVLQHPETVGEERAAEDIEAVLGAVADTRYPALMVFPNSDAGSRAMMQRLGQGRRELAVVASLPRPDFATLLAGSAALVGNSSAGIIEAPMLRVPAVNVGNRQSGRLRGDNVIDVPADRAAIEKAIARATDRAFRNGLSGVSPYGDGTAAPRVLDFLEALVRTVRLLRKRVGVATPDRMAVE
jgi:UDP-N-acetylglucosamine 2-epimerase (non-hydrolysing)/GDP/UDP-N,N'-diacetylbacillosamine 2-epimerase (hydrolysing)